MFSLKYIQNCDLHKRTDGIFHYFLVKLHSKRFTSAMKLLVSTQKPPLFHPELQRPRNRHSTPRKTTFESRLYIWRHTQSSWCHGHHQLGLDLYFNFSNLMNCKTLFGQTRILYEANFSLMYGLEFVVVSVPHWVYMENRTCNDFRVMFVNNVWMDCILFIWLF